MASGYDPSGSGGGGLGVGAVGGGGGQRSGLLTEAQRMVMDAALEEREVLLKKDLAAVGGGPRPPHEHATAAAKHLQQHQAKVEMKAAAAGGGGGQAQQQQHHHVAAVSHKQERRSHALTNGRPKKGGGGGKGAWGDPLNPKNYEVSYDLDPGDPMYDDDDEDVAAKEKSSYEKLLVASAPARAAEALHSYKQRVSSLVSEYFANANVDDALSGLTQLANDLASAAGPAVAAAAAAAGGLEAEEAERGGGGGGEEAGAGAAYHHHFVKRLVFMALDRHERERELAAQLLSAAYAAVVPPAQMAKGFLSVLEGADDVALDCPDAEQVLAVFLARAIVDDVLPPAFLRRARLSLGGEKEGGAEDVGGGQGTAGAATGSASGEGVEEGSAAAAAAGDEDGGGGRRVGLAVVRRAEAWLKTPHHAEALEKYWGGGGGEGAARWASLEAAKAAVQRLLKEYVASGDVGEALRCVRDLNLPFFHHEVVKSALVMAMEHPGSTEVRLLALLRAAAEEGVVSLSQVDKGFARVAAAIDDLALDVPSAPDHLQRIVAQALHEGWLTRAAARRLWGDLVAAETSVATDQSKVLHEYKDKCALIVREYFVSGDAGEAGRSLEELAYPDLLHHFVKRLVSAAMDRGNRQREMASQLLSTLFEDVIPADQVELGFLRLLESVDDLALDIPNVPTFLALFLARAVIDDVLPPHFVANLTASASGSATDAAAASPSSATAAATGSAPAAAIANGTPVEAAATVLEATAAAAAKQDSLLSPAASGPAAASVPLLPSALAREVSQQAAAMLAARHAGERILRCWGAAGRSADDAKQRIARVLEEFAAGGELAEACLCLREMKLPFFHHEVVKKAVVMAMERKTSRPLELLIEAARENLITVVQMGVGLQRVARELPDLVLDIPDARVQLAAIVAKGAQDGWVPPEADSLEKLDKAVEEADSAAAATASADAAAAAEAGDAGGADGKAAIAAAAAADAASEPAQVAEAPAL